MEDLKIKQHIFEDICTMVKQQLVETQKNESKRHVYYISAEFLLGKMLASNLINLGLYEQAELLAKEKGYDLRDILDIEQEPSLGNGGLGRLAACYLDSIAALELPGDGIGLCYHFGLFKQQFHNFKQEEVPDGWLDKNIWLQKTNVSYDVVFPTRTVQSSMYDMDIPGFHGGKNTLHLFDLETCDETLVKDGITFDKTAIDRNLTLFLYPDDSDEEGRLLRIYQQYFMVSNAAQFILQDCKNKGFDLHHLDDYVCIQINDTHPSMIIPELIRLLMKEDILMKDAIAIIRSTCAYTNHTILAEALETWPRNYLKQVVPHLLEIIEALDAIIYQAYSNEKVQIIDTNNRVHMAHMDIHFGKTVNGVAALHTDILKHTELKVFYDIYPNKFQNKTNGITFRRWLYACNPELTNFLKKYCSKTKFDCDEFHELMKYRDDESVLLELLTIKQTKKQQFVRDMKKLQGIDLNVASIFDVQSKRLHEYKRQQMNALYIIYKYKQIKQGVLPKRPITFIFGAKAAPAYTIAKDIIHLLLCIQELLEKDPEVSKWIRICFVENYNVSMAEKLVPACDISEQISLASKEASGTGNMKFMLNGALTLGTRDGANVEIEQFVKDAIYIFGKNSDEVISLYENESYVSKKIYDEDKNIQEWVDFILSKELLSIGDQKSLQRLHDELLNKDWFMTLLDINEYIACKDKMMDDYENRITWAKNMLVNISESGFFSSDRAIREYNNDIWKL